MWNNGRRGPKLQINTAAAGFRATFVGGFRSSLMYLEETAPFGHGSVSSVFPTREGRERFREIRDGICENGEF
jgi:hypothetical protein